MPENVRPASLPDRRRVLALGGVAALSAALPGRAWALPRGARRLARGLDQTLRLGLIADLHQDIMHDGPARLAAFAEAMAAQPIDGVMQLGDFAYPKAANAAVIDGFRDIHEHRFHVIGNHDTDAGHTKEQCQELWGMPHRYFAADLAGLQLIVLDGNVKGSPTHRGGYASYVGPEQRDWLKGQLQAAKGPVLVASHQPLAGAAAVDDAAEVQEILSAAADKVLLAINGHTHIDHLLRVGGVSYLHVNSASYYWVGGDHRHASYAPEVHEGHPWIECTCPYQEAVFATLVLDPSAGRIRVEGRRSRWQGSDPAELGLRPKEVIHGENIVPWIRDRDFR